MTTPAPLIPVQTADVFTRFFLMRQHAMMETLAPAGKLAKRAHVDHPLKRWNAPRWMNVTSLGAVIQLQENVPIPSNPTILLVPMMIPAPVTKIARKEFVYPELPSIATTETNARRIAVKKVIVPTRP
jgi:hypothetical protein